MKFLRYSIACLSLVILASCSKMKDNYYDFIKNGPIVYTGKADSLKAFAGKRRVMLSWLLTSDQTIAGCKVFWNFGLDSLDVPVVKTAGTDTVKVYIDDLDEGSYNFVIYTYDKAGHRSVGSEVIGNAYDSIFMSTLTNKPVRSVKKEAALSKITVVWVGRDAKCLGTEWDYTGSDQSAQHLFAPLADTTVITSCDVNKPVAYRTLYVPEQNAIDTFYTAYKPL